MPNRASEADAADTGLLPAPAQTNVALYKQLLCLGCDRTTLIHMRDCYEFAARLLAGQFRASGKSFIAHLVGTASILAAIGAPPAVMAAGLVHAAYDFGDFGWMPRRNRRARVRAAIGDAAEALVWRYHELGWTGSVIANLSERLAGASATDRAVLLMRLANELDDSLDLAIPYPHLTPDEHRARQRVFVVMARRLDQRRLGNSLTAIYREGESGAWETALSLNRAGGYLLAPSLRLQLRNAMRTLQYAIGRR